MTGDVIAELGADYVRGELNDDRTSRCRASRRSAFAAGCGISATRSRPAAKSSAAAKQDRVFGAETPTDGYTTCSSCSRRTRSAGGGAVNTITARLDNATNELYRNHLSFIKDLVPEMGRNFKLLYSVKF